MKRPALWLALVLILLTFSLLAYRILRLGYPVFPTAPGKTWQFSIEAKVLGDRGEVDVEMGLPTEHAGRMVVEEKISTGDLNVNLYRQGPNRVGLWSGAVGREGEEIAYRATILTRARRPGEGVLPTSDPFPAGFDREETALAQRLAAGWGGLSLGERIQAVAATVRGEWKAPPPDMKDLQAWKDVVEKHGRATSLLLFLRAARLSARAVEGMKLAEEIFTRPLGWVEVWNGRGWEILRVETGEIDRNYASYLPLSTGGVPAWRMLKGELVDIRWSLSRQIVSQWSLHFERIHRSNHLLDRWSLFRLPLDFQQTFRILLLVPIGALIIGFLRNIIGFPTFGIFMPVLMALAFRSTGLAYGLGVFFGVLFIGYGVRRALDRLRLLLVPRMSVLLTLVIVCFIFLALLGNHWGLRQFMAVGLLPFVILTMVIERFFVLIEEAGAQEGLRTAAGSAAVAVISYEIISWEPLQLTFFVYPELLAGVAAVQILLGRYTGYRLSELVRFRALGRPS